VILFGVVSQHFFSNRTSWSADHSTQVCTQ